MQAAKNNFLGKQYQKMMTNGIGNANRNVTRALNRAGMAIEVKRDTLSYEVGDGTVS